MFGLGIFLLILSMVLLLILVCHLEDLGWFFDVGMVAWLMFFLAGVILTCIGLGVW